MVSFSSLPTTSYSSIKNQQTLCRLDGDVSWVARKHGIGKMESNIICCWRDNACVEGTRKEIQHKMKYEIRKIDQN